MTIGDRTEGKSFAQLLCLATRLGMKVTFIRDVFTIHPDAMLIRIDAGGGHQVVRFAVDDRAHPEDIMRRALKNAIVGYIEGWKYELIRR